MPQKSQTTKVFDYVVGVDSTHNLPFPEEGDTLWIGDSRGTIVEKSFDPLHKNDVKRDGDTTHTRYIEVKLLVKI